MLHNLSLIGANHNIWCMKISHFVTANGEMPPIKSHRECELGKWLYSEGLSNYGHIDEVKTLEKEHRQLHSIAENIIQLKNNSHKAQAQQQLFVMQEHSEKIINLLKACQSKLTRFGQDS